jgi:hypothetical protein
MLSDTELAVLSKGMNYFISFPHFDLDIMCAVESAAANLPQSFGTDLRWRIRTMIEKYRNLPINLTTEELRGLKS